MSDKYTDTRNSEKFFYAKSKTALSGRILTLGFFDESPPEIHL